MSECPASLFELENQGYRGWEFCLEVEHLRWERVGKGLHLSEDRARETHTHNISWACWGKNTLLYFSLTHTLTMLLTPVVWVFHTASISLSPAGCPITHSSFGTTYTVLASDPTSERLSHTSWGFPQNSVGKESACNAGDPGSIPGLGRSPGEG